LTPGSPAARGTGAPEVVESPEDSDIGPPEDVDVGSPLVRVPQRERGDKVPILPPLTILLVGRP
jgi:hypothetical protein